MSEPTDEMDLVCHNTPPGWRCTRGAGHEGPCAAVAAPEDLALVARGMERLREARPAWAVTRAEQDAMSADQWFAWREALMGFSAPTRHRLVELQYHQALDCLNSVMRAASHVLVSLPPSEKEAKLRDVLSKAHDWYMAERLHIAAEPNNAALKAAGTPA